MVPYMVFAFFVLVNLIVGIAVEAFTWGFGSSFMDKAEEDYKESKQKKDKKEGKPPPPEIIEDDIRKFQRNWESTEKEIEKEKKVVVRQGWLPKADVLTLLRLLPEPLGPKPPVDAQTLIEESQTFIHESGAVGKLADSDDNIFYNQAIQGLTAHALGLDLSKLPDATKERLGKLVSLCACIS